MTANMICHTSASSSASMTCLWQGLQELGSSHQLETRPAAWKAVGWGGLLPGEHHNAALL